jgi:hypothetical protein
MLKFSGIQFKKNIYKDKTNFFMKNLFSLKTKFRDRTQSKGILYKLIIFRILSFSKIIKITLKFNSENTIYLMTSSYQMHLNVYHKT